MLIWAMLFLLKITVNVFIFAIPIFLIALISILLWEAMGKAMVVA
jgi:hypothetical protein